MRIKYFLLILLLFMVSFLSCRKNTVEIKFYDAAQAEIIAPNKNRVIIDAVNTNRLTSPITKKDIILFTHKHSDHFNIDTAHEYALEELLFKKGTYEEKGIKITAIPSVHHNMDKITDENATNYIFLIEVNGLRICHLGDIGQEHFTDEQLAQLGRIDICFTQLENRQSNMTMMNKKGFTLINELNPRIVIPTHFKDRSLEYALENYPVYAGSEDPVTFKLDDLPETTTFVIMGTMASVYGTVYNLESYE